MVHKHDEKNETNVLDALSAHISLTPTNKFNVMVYYYYYYFLPLLSLLRFIMHTMQKVTVQNKIIVKPRFHLEVSKNKPHR